MYIPAIYYTTDPVPGTKERKFKDAVKKLMNNIKAFDFIVRAIKNNKDNYSGLAKDLYFDIKNIKLATARVTDKVKEIIKYWIDVKPKNDYELMKLLRDEVEMLGYLEHNELNILEHTFNYLQENWKRFFSSWFGVSGNVFDLDGLYEAAADIEEYFGGDLSVWDNIKLSLDTLVRLSEAIDDIKSYIIYQQNQLNYVSKWEKEHGSIPTDKIYPEGVENLEIMWHVTTSCHKVLQEGLKAKKDLPEAAGLGGGSSDLISFTASYPHAQYIMKSLLENIELAKNKRRNLGDIINMAINWGMTDSQIESVLEHWPYKMPDMDEPISFDTAHNFYELFALYSSQFGVSYSAVVFAPDEKVFRKIDPKNVCIVEAIVDTTDPKTTYHRAEEEWRIPPECVISLGLVGSQHIEK